MIEDDLNVIKIIKNLRNLKIYSNNINMNLKTKFLIDHSHKNVINLEGSDSSNNSSFDDDNIDS